jgi:hypothetical protein
MTPLYRRILDSDPNVLALRHKVWDPTPWVIDVRSDDEKRFEHREWLFNNVGKESWPIHEKPGDWYFSGATVQGQTWLGFSTEEMMQRFIAAFPESII